MFRLKISHLQASTILCQMLLPTLGSQSVYIYYLKLPRGLFPCLFFEDLEYLTEKNVKELNVCFVVLYSFYLKRFGLSKNAWRINGTCAKRRLCLRVQ